MNSKTFEHIFEIGDFVSIVQEVHNYERLLLTNNEDTFYRRTYLPMAFLVIGLWAEYCYGGLQIHYKVKHQDKNGGLLISDYTEIEVCPAYVSPTKEK